MANLATELPTTTQFSPPTAEFIMICLDRHLPDYAFNMRRLMAREGLTLTDVQQRTGLNHRTLKEILAGRRRPQPRTLHQLAAGLDVPVEELYQDAALLRHRLFDRHTNPVVDEVIASQPRLFHGWTPAEFDELYSRFGTGGALTREGTETVVRTMNERRDLHAKVALLLETTEAELLASMIDVLYRRVVVAAPGLSDGEQLANELPITLPIK
jgi:transcriptional regulator with XRE-family HTH domain